MSILFSVVLLATTTPPPGIDWHLYAADCVGGVAQFEFACGDYGRFLVRQQQAPPPTEACLPIAERHDEPPLAYPFPGPGPHHFPITAKRLREITLNAPTTAPQPQPLTFKASAAATGGGTTSPAPPSAPLPWIAVLDFDNAHGESTAYLAGRVAGTQVSTVLAPIDDPALTTLGPVGDLHVLARLCEIAEAVDREHVTPPTVINMSFGRPHREEIPLDPESSECTQVNAACQIARVLGHLIGDPARMLVVAAAGNHGSELFPGSLEEVIPAGMLDPTAFVAGGVVEPAWETPGDAEAWIPGSSLCLSGWPAPAGSSYSSAMLAGWLVQPAKHPEVVATLGPDPWQPAWRASCQGYVLTRGVKSTPWCNARVTELIGALKTPPAPCGGAAVGPIAVVPPGPGRSIPPDPGLPSIDTYGDPTRPTPESDPCVPCTGELTAGPTGADLSIDLSKSGPLPAEVVFDEVFLRVDEFFYPIGLTPEQLGMMAVGGLATIVIQDGGDLVPVGSSLSLWYQLRPMTVASCATPSDCFWSSTPLLVGGLR